MTATNITQSEWDDFDQVLSEYKRNRTEFEIKETVQRPTTACIEHLRGATSIKLIKREISKVYQAGLGSSWVVDFEDDLCAGVFGP